ncbi:unnamed protein product [Prunus brigantina]
MEMFVGAKAVPFSAESAIMVKANVALEGCLFAMELGLTCTQRNSWTASMATSEGDDGVCTPFSLEFAIIITTATIAPGLGRAGLETKQQIVWQLSHYRANKYVMLCAGLDGSNSSELEVVLLSLT